MSDPSSPLPLSAVLLSSCNASCKHTNIDIDIVRTMLSSVLHDCSHDMYSPGRLQAAAADRPIESCRTEGVLYGKGFSCFHDLESTAL